MDACIARIQRWELWDHWEAAAQRVRGRGARMKKRVGDGDYKLTWP